MAGAPTVVTSENMNQKVATFLQKSLLRLLAVGFSLVMVCLALEAGLRFWYGHPAGPIRWLSMGGNHPRFLFFPDFDMGYRLRPFFEGYEVQPNGDFCLPIMINQWGLRDTHDLRNLHSFRILGVGDSFTFGEGVATEKTFLAIMEKKLRDLHPETDCINAGTPGYGLRQIFTQARELVPIIKPQVLLLPFRPTLFNREEAPFRYSNGYIFKPPVYREIVEYGDWATFTFPQKGALRELDLKLQRHSVLYLFLKYPVYDRIYRAVFLRNFRFVLRKEDLTVSFSILNTMNQWCLQRNIALIVVPLCSDEKEAALLDQLLSEHSLAGKSIVIDEWQKDFPKPRRLTFAHDIHLNEDGHAEVARRMTVIFREFYRGQ